MERVSSFVSFSGFNRRMPQSSLNYFVSICFITGKTTTMGMLTAEFPPTSGDATLAGYSVSREPQKTRRRIGYCPQFDAHFNNVSNRIVI
jgi:ABC-type proline/glycine betaine transport system ATPase subunit